MKFLLIFCLFPFSSLWLRVARDYNATLRGVLTLLYVS
jgi:uncharacterized membrane protein